ncbi:endonuclease/exonuclease/phosphatase family protein [Micromonospora polyrhachis]|uniref:Endonuclease/exonuclease/phosphatase family metal-dependent hydrolase n=1 Tax=Micromonospora polyrhachis TaxID=1282883 RepID=A0A7W7WMX5_9ACTN|nr:endonuclease/exonuclease/phosphatase family protein [Micromonospora polyrhachis]MBB4957586.1 endonuclease/exonuclease/phosphatase family metal-dependent hydrolase [Micromonospora polyrhachis]
MSSLPTLERPAEPPHARRRPGRTLLTWLCWLAVAPALIWAALRITGFDRGPLVPLLAFTPYVAGWTVVPVALALALRRWWAAGVAVLTAVALIGVVAPRALADNDPLPGGSTLRVLTANLLVGVADPAAVVELVRAHRVDVLAVQEFTPEAQAALDRHGLADLLPHRQLNAEVGSPGSGLYARFPLSAGGTRTNDGGFTQAYATVHMPDAPAVLVESAHPCAPYEHQQLRCWHTDLDRQPRATPDGPLRILAGDFNATLDHAPLRALLDTGYVDAAAAAGVGLTGTWGPYDGDFIPPVAIDHVLVDRRIGVRAASVHPLPGSDHRALLAELALPPLLGR